MTTEMKEEASSTSQKLIRLIWIKHSKAALIKMVWRSNLAQMNMATIGPDTEKFQAATGGAVEERKEQMSRKTYMIALGFAGVLSFGWLGASHVAAFPTNAAAIKAAAPVSVIDVRGGRGGGGFRGGGFRGGGGRYAGGGFRGGGRYAGGARFAGGGRYAGGGRWAAGGYRGGRYVAGGYRGGYYGGGWGGYRPWGAAAAGAALGAAAAGAAYYNQPYYYGQQCGYYPYPPCY